MKDWKTVLVTLVMLVLCMAPCVAIALAGETSEPETAVTSTYASRENSVEAEPGVLDIVSLGDVGILVAAGAVISVMCVAIPNDRAARRPQAEVISEA